MPFELSPSVSPAVRDMKQALSALETEEGRMAGVRFRPRPGDVIVATPPKSGTTLCLQIIHSLRTRGDMSFEELNLVIPCLEMAWDCGYRDLDAVQVALPRVYKTHFWRRDCPAADGARYVYVVRNPLDAGLSFYSFFSGWFFQPGAVTLEEFLEEFFLARGAPPTAMQNASHWHNLASWFPHRRDPNCLFLFYEDFLVDLPASVALIADFLQLGHDDPALQAVAVEQAGIEHMQRFPEKYDEHMLKLARNEACGLPRRAGLDGASAGKVHKGGSGRGLRALSPPMQAAFQRKWEEVVLPATGYASYEELRAGVNRELGRTAFNRRR